MQLLQAGASADVRNANGDNALLLAAAAGEHEISKLLARKCNIDVFTKDREGKNAIDKAVEVGKKELAQMLTMEACVRWKMQVNLNHLIS
jgi:ankyrin repeat protein